MKSDVDNSPTMTENNRTNRCLHHVIKNDDDNSTTIKTAVQSAYHVMKNNNSLKTTVQFANHVTKKNLKQNDC